MNMRHLFCEVIGETLKPFVPQSIWFGFVAGRPAIKDIVLNGLVTLFTGHNALNKLSELSVNVELSIEIESALSWMSHIEVMKLFTDRRLKRMFAQCS
jgi:hypothetical protein